jgi:hypothetical protein
MTQLQLETLHDLLRDGNLIKSQRSETKLTSLNYLNGKEDWRASLLAHLTEIANLLKRY